MQFSKWKIGAVALVCMLLPGSVHAQIVKNERLLSFEEKQVPAFVTTAAGSQLGISDEHYRDGDHSLSWTFEPGAALSIKKDLKFEKKANKTGNGGRNACSSLFNRIGQEQVQSTRYTNFDTYIYRDRYSSQNEVAEF